MKHASLTLLLCFAALLASSLVLHAQEESVWESNMREGKRLEASGRYAEAEQRYLAARESVRTAPSQRAYVVATAQLGDVYVKQGKGRDAEIAFAEVLPLCEKERDELGIAILLNGLGEACRLQGRRDETRRYLERSLAILERSGNELEQALVENNLASLFIITGRVKEAQKLLQKAVSTYRRLMNGDRVEMLSNLSLAFRLAGELDQARAAAEHAVLLCRDAGEKARCIDPLNNLGSAFFAAREYEPAARHFDAALMLARTNLMHEHPSTIALVNNLAVVLMHLGQLERAEALFTEAITLDESAADRSLLSHELFQYAALLKKTHRKAEARRAESRARAALPAAFSVDAALLAGHHR